MKVSNENKDKKLEAVAEQWINLVFAHIESVKQQNQKPPTKESNKQDE